MVIESEFPFVVGSIGQRCCDEEGVELEQFQFDACLSGLLASGDGSKDTPYRVTYTSDVGDLLSALGKTSLAQHLVQRPDGCFDLVSCADGVELWFARPELDAVHDAAVTPLRLFNMPSAN